jgi:hypothetical protein
MRPGVIKEGTVEVRMIEAPTCLVKIKYHLQVGSAHGKKSELPIFPGLK